MAACARLRRRERRDGTRVELVVRRDDAEAEAFVDDVRNDDAELADSLRLEPVELEA